MAAGNAFTLTVALIIAGMTFGADLASGGTMTKNSLIQKIESSGLEPEIGAVLELELGQPPEMPDDEYKVEPAGFEQFAMDGSGGTFNVMPDGRILLIDSEGSFGVVASDFNEFIAIATGLPSWRDALRFVGGPDPGRARAAWAAYVEKWELDKALDKPWPYDAGGYSVATPGAARKAIRSRLEVEASPDPFAALHHAVNTLNGDVAVSWRGEPLVLFGR
jgi:hypothetical protein